MILTVEAYIKAGIRIQGGVIWDLLRNSRVKYHGGPVATYHVEYNQDGKWESIGFNYATNGKPLLQPLENLDMPYRTAY